ncbi:FAD-binding domain-containing protein [Corynespora cassiicola Philippines]|uniref:FAD-binding domain-containing protein n=1 Tax=Corynespora cassiicola Philippines TaxID=1448308 RepID=A0A2T2NWP0_CORCC|nr:FAD-binding domain-containing protein [Corynespora cassiicola Philippines]
MKALTVTVLLNIALLVASKPSKGEVKIGCDILKGKYPSSVFFPGEARYDFENEYGWSTTSWLGPACIFTPETPEQVSFAITTFSENNIKFAVRSGGAMPIDNAANIGAEGVLIANTNFTSISMSEDNSIVTVATGVRWPQLYAYLDDYNVTVNGIRMGNVGVVGYFLGGGIGFFSYEHGTGSVSVESFEVVLADGSIAEASLTQNEDLFWALRGGGNNFAIVTSVKIRTLNVPTIYASPVSYGSGAEVQQRYIQSLVEFAEYADADPKASMEGQIRWVPSRSPDIFFDAFLFHSEDSSPSPLGLQNFTAPVFPTTSGNLTQTTMGTWANQFPYDTDVGNRKLFHFFSIPANARAMEICLDEYYKAVAHLAEREGFFTAFSIMPITRRVIEKSTENGGNPVGLDADSAPALWLVESPSWLNAADDADVYAAHDAANAAIDSALAAEGFDQLRFIYLSDASKSQIEEVFPSYGPANVDRLQQIRNQYDPESVFTDLLVGGAKVARA